MQLYAYEGTANVHLRCMNGQLPTPRYLMPIIVPSYQHCDEQQFQTLLCALYTFVFSNKARFSVAIPMDREFTSPSRYAISMVARASSSLGVTCLGDPLVKLESPTCLSNTN